MLCDIGNGTMNIDHSGQARRHGPVLHGKYGTWCMLRAREGPDATLWDCAGHHP